MNIVLIGATGFVGSQVLKEALLRNHQLTAIARDPQKVTTTHPLLRVVKGEVMNLNEFIPLLKEADVVISAYNAGWKNPRLYAEYLEGSRMIQNACKKG